MIVKLFEDFNKDDILTTLENMFLDVAEGIKVNINTTTSNTSYNVSISIPIKIIMDGYKLIYLKDTIYESIQFMQDENNWSCDLELIVKKHQRDYMVCDSRDVQKEQDIIDFIDNGQKEFDSKDYGSAWLNRTNAVRVRILFY